MANDRESVRCGAIHRNLGSVAPTPVSARRDRSTRFAEQLFEREPRAAAAGSICNLRPDFSARWRTRRKPTERGCGWFDSFTSPAAESWLRARHRGCASDRAVGRYRRAVRRSRTAFVHSPVIAGETVRLRQSHSQRTAMTGSIRPTDGGQRMSTNFAVAAGNRAMRHGRFEHRAAESAGVGARRSTLAAVRPAPTDDGIAHSPLPHPRPAGVGVDAAAAL